MGIPAIDHGPQFLPHSGLPAANDHPPPPNLTDSMSAALLLPPTSAARRPSPTPTYDETLFVPHIRHVTKNARYSTGEKVVHSDDLHQYVTHAAIVNIPLKADEPLLLRRLQDAHWVFPRETPDVLSLPTESHSQLKSYSVATRTCLDEEAARDGISLGDEWKMQCRGD
ncbi:hypothetical protein K443DRAFT_8976 [Laccaria amethystina LaAM-08-1]|uniref:Uncharacterized protein n=1 Tax=Laccaria amethystina LaAM-08-1 TaxID=1095629 RepID=A0A0C9WN13_9AGAR|nr:hypothetical protein K443DRAFT_8976 [Laccaria amethystina LaAM-08-1]